MNDARFVRDQVRVVVDPLILRLREEIYGSGISFGTSFAEGKIPSSVAAQVDIVPTVEAAGFIKGIVTWSGLTQIATDQTQLVFEGVSVTTAGDTTTITVADGRFDSNLFYTKSQTDTLLSTKASSTHTHLHTAITDWDAAVAATPSVSANTAKITNAFHTGDVVGSGFLSIQDDAVTFSKIADAGASPGQVIVYSGGNWTAGYVTVGSGTLVVHAPSHAIGGSDPVTPEMIGAASGIALDAEAAARIAADLVVATTSGLGHIIVGNNLTISGGVLSAVNVTGMLDPTTTAGDMIYRSGGAPIRLPVGASGYVLQSDGVYPTWAATSGIAGIDVTTDDAQTFAKVQGFKITNSYVTIAGGVPVITPGITVKDDGSSIGARSTTINFGSGLSVSLTNANEVQVASVGGLDLAAHEETVASTTVLGHIKTGSNVSMSGEFLNWDGVAILDMNGTSLTQRDVLQLYRGRVQASGGKAARIIPAIRTETVAGLLSDDTEILYLGDGITATVSGTGRVVLTAGNAADFIIQAVTSGITNKAPSADALFTYFASNPYDTRYYTKSATDTLLAGKANVSHTHTHVAITDWDEAIAASPAVVANTAKVTNATHTGMVTGDTVLTIASGVVTPAMLSVDGVLEGQVILFSGGAWHYANQGEGVTIASGNIDGGFFTAPGATIQMKRGNHADIPTLAIGEFGWELDTKDLYIGHSTGGILVQDARRIRGRDVSVSSPATGEALTWTGSQFQNAKPHADDSDKLGGIPASGYAYMTHTTQIASSGQLGHIRIGAGINIDPYGILSVPTYSGLYNPMTDEGDMIIGRSVAAVNLARSATGAVAYVNGSYHGSPANNIIDDNEATVWDGSGPVANAWAMVDLQTPMAVGGWRLNQVSWTQDGGTPGVGNFSEHADGYKFQYSTDNSTWNDVFEFFTNAPDDTGFMLMTSPITARYWRVYATTGGLWGWDIRTFALYEVTPSIERLPIGTSGQVLTVVSGLPHWETPASGVGGGVGDPTTTAGDIIYRSPTGLNRLPIGDVGQVLTTVSGLPAWQDSSGIVLASGGTFFNPMTTVGDMIIGSSGTVGTTDLVITPTGGTASYSAISTFSGDPVTYAPSKAADNNATTDWASNGAGAGAWWQVDWSVDQAISRVVLRDRSISDNWLDGTISFSDGSSVLHSSLPTDGSPLTVSFPTKVVTWMRITATSPAAANPGLAEVSAYYDSTVDGSAVRLPIGAQGQVLTTVDGLPMWQDISVTISGGDIGGVMHATGDMIIGAGTDYTNVALNSLGVSVLDNGTYETNYPTNAFDNDDTTQWFGNQTNTSWIRVDLLSSLKITAWQVLQAGTNWYRNFVLQSSNDGTTWTTEESAYATGVPPIDTGIIPLPAPVTARYWRLYTDDASYSGNGFGWGIKSFKVFTGGTAGEPARLAIGSEGQILTVASGVPAWRTGADPLPSGGVNGQVLTLASGVPSWLTPSGITGSTSENGPSGFDFIKEILISSDTASVTISDIPSSYVNLRMYVKARTNDTSSTFGAINQRFNGDSGSNYDSQINQSLGTNFYAGGVSGGTYATVGDTMTANSVTDAFSTNVFEYPFYAESGHKTILAQSNQPRADGTILSVASVARWRNNATISEITLTPAAGSFVAGTRIVLYGVGRTNGATISSTSIIDTVYDAVSISNTDSIDRLVEQDDFVSLVYLASHNANSWKPADTSYIVPSGKKLLVLGAWSTQIITVDTGNRRARLYNVTDSTPVLDYQFFQGTYGALTFPWGGDISDPSMLTEIPAGKEVRIDLWNGDSNKRANGAAVIMRLVPASGNYTPPVRGGSAASTVYISPFDKPPTVAHALDDEFNGTSLSSKWTNISTGTDLQWTSSITNGWGYFEPAQTGTGSTSKYLMGIRQNAPTGSFSVYAKIADNRGGDDVREGVFVSDGTRFHICGSNRANSTLGAAIGGNNYSETGDAGVYDGYYTTYGSNVIAPLWAKIDWDAGTSTLTFSISANGVFWDVVDTRGSMNQPTRVGLAMWSQNTGSIAANHTLAVDYFRVTE